MIFVQIYKKKISPKKCMPTKEQRNRSFFAFSWNCISGQNKSTVHLCLLLERVKVEVLSNFRFIILQGNNDIKYAEIINFGVLK